MVENRIVLVNEFVATGFDKAATQVNAASSSVSKFNTALTVEQQALINARSGIMAYNDLTKQGVKLTANQAAELDALNQGYVAMGGSTKNLNDKTQDLLTSFTKLRWMIVNVAMIAAVGYGIAKIGMDAEKTRFEIERLAITASESYQQVREAVVETQKLTMESNANVISSYQELTKSGFNLKESQDILAASAGASLVGFSDLKSTAMATAQVLRQFNIDSSHAGDIAYEMAAAANAGRVDINTMGEALKFSGAIANQAGTSFEEMAASVAILSNKGLEMSQIGRGQRQVLISLLSPSSQAESALRAYNIQIKDTDGSLKSFNEIMREFGTKLSGLSEAEKQNIIGKIFPSNAITIVLESMGEVTDQVDALKNSLDELGSASRIDAITLQSQNAFTLASAWESATLALKGYTSELIKMSSPATSKSASYVASLKQEILDLGESTGQLSESAKKYVEGISPTVKMPSVGSAVYNIVKSRTIGALTYAESDVQYLEKVKDELLKTTEAKKKLDVITSSGNKEVAASLTAVNDKMNYYAERYDLAVRKVTEYNSALEKIKSTYSDTAEAQQIINQYTDDYITILGVEGSDVVAMFQDLIKPIKDASDATKEYSDRNKELQSQLSKVGTELSNLQSEISAIEQRIDNIKSRRFNIRGISETNIGHLIAQQQLELEKAQFATLGLGSAEEFLRNASLITADGLNAQTEAMRKLTAATDEGMDRYDAWRDALSETIRALLINSQDIDRDVTGVIKNAQTELLSLNKADSKKSSQFNVMENNLSYLQDAQSIFFGEEQENLRYSEQLYEDKTNGMNESAAAAIQNLSMERSLLASLISEEDRWKSNQESIRAEMAQNQRAIDNETASWNARNAAMNRGGGGGGGTAPWSGATPNPMAPYTPSSPFEQELSARLGIPSLPVSPFNSPLGNLGNNSLLTNVRPIDYSNPFGDFISRPGQPAAVFSPQDTVIGVKDASKLGGSTVNATININGYNRDQRELAIEIKRQLSSLA